jgi:hypothetical protein
VVVAKALRGGALLLGPGKAARAVCNHVGISSPRGAISPVTWRAGAAHCAGGGNNGAEPAAPAILWGAAGNCPATRA